ncbi:MAG: hypothetical protein HKN62_03790 [Phycisphaerales bacterium]|nr:hypothetical protein [Phycisphaerales bacterium]
MPRKLTDETIFAFADGTLPADEHAAVTAAFRDDPAAARRLALYRSAARSVREDDTVAPPAPTVVRAKAIFTPAPEPSVAWVASLQRTIAELIYDSRVQLAAVRSAATERRFELTYEQNDCSVDLQAERLTTTEPESGDPRWRLQGQIGGPNRPDELEVVVTRAGSETPIVATAADEGAYFCVELAPGRYDLHLKLADGVLVLPDLDVS